MGEENKDQKTIKTLDEINTEMKILDDKIAKSEVRLAEIETAKSNLLATGGFTSNIFTPGANSDEKMAMRYFGVSHPKKLLDVNVMHQNFLRVPEHLKFLVLDLKKDMDIARMMMQRLYGEPLDRYDPNDNVITRVKGVLDGTYFGREVLAPKLKQFSTTADTEWVPTAVSSRFFEEFELERRVESQFVTINMPSNPYDLPTQDSTTKARIQAENATISDVTFATGKLTMDATKLTEFSILSTEITEDSAPDILAAARNNVMEAQMRAVEDSIINGDDTATMDSDIGGATDNRRAWKGLRKLAIDNSANGSTVDFVNAAITLAKCRDMRTAMGKFGVSAVDLRWFVSTKTVNGFIALDEVTTVEKFGPQATIVTGEIGRLDGIPIVITEFQRDDLNASGVHDGVTTDRGVIQLVNRRRFFKGQRRAIKSKITMHPVPPNDQWLMASWQRADWIGHTQDATEVSDVLGFNIA